MKTKTVLFLLTLSACEGDPMGTEDILDSFPADKLGTSTIVFPDGTLGNNGEKTKKKLIEISVPDGKDTPLLVSVRCEYAINMPAVSQTIGPGGALIGPTGTGAPILGFPIVGRVEWGVGGALNAVEFDIPSAKNSAFLSPIGRPDSQPVTDIGNGVQVYVTGSSVRLFVRNDGNIAPLTAFGGFPGAAVATAGRAFPVKVQAFVSRGQSRGGAPLVRVIYIAAAYEGGSLPAGGEIRVTIPPFARRVRFFRSPIDATSLAVDSFDTFSGLNTLRNFLVPVNVDGPFELQPTEGFLSVTNTSATAITAMQAVFDVDPI